MQAAGGPIQVATSPIKFRPARKNARWRESSSDIGAKLMTSSAVEAAGPAFKRKCGCEDEGHPSKTSHVEAGKAGLENYPWES